MLRSLELGRPHLVPGTRVHAGVVRGLRILRQKDTPDRWHWRLCKRDDPATLALLLWSPPDGRAVLGWLWRGGRVWKMDWMTG